MSLSITSFNLAYPSMCSLLALSCIIGSCVVFRGINLYNILLVLIMLDVLKTYWLTLARHNPLYINFRK